MKAAGTLIAALLVASVSSGCGGSSTTAASPTATRAAVSSNDTNREHALRQAAHSALNKNLRLSLYVLWNNRIPGWARQSTRGPALAALRTSAVARRKRGIRIRSLPGRYTIISLHLDPSYTRATAIVHDQRRVIPYHSGQRVGRAIVVDDHATVQLRRVEATARFVVWQVTPKR
jgi:hypothetical protein